MKQGFDKPRRKRNRNRNWARDEQKVTKEDKRSENSSEARKDFKIREKSTDRKPKVTDKNKKFLSVKISREKNRQ